MIKVYKTINDVTKEIVDLESGVWINLTNPTQNELATVRLRYNVDESQLKAALDEEESPRIDVEDESTLFIIDVPYPYEDGVNKGGRIYGTIPLGIIIAEDAIITVSTSEIKPLTDFTKMRVKGFHTEKKTRMILQIMYKNATYYLFYLKQIDRISEGIQKELHKSMKNEELLELLSLEKSLVYFTTSLKSNEIVFEKMMRLDSIKQYADDKDLLEDVIIENKQAIEMSETYSNILNGIMGVVGSIISNNLNIVMKFLASITIILAIPNIVAGIMGMNVRVPFANEPYGFLVMMGVIVVLTLSVGYYMFKKRLL
ncbi:MAG: magnesium transporter CorA family protein [Peptostreptococcaceae bacterium]|nr:magnesium transporter CorA family protein [Peptostreptococcaceae bacterium]